MKRESFKTKMDYYAHLYYAARLFPRKKKKSERKFAIKLMVLLDTTSRYCEERGLIW